MMYMKTFFHLDHLDEKLQSVYYSKFQDKQVFDIAYLLQGVLK